MKTLLLAAALATATLPAAAQTMDPAVVEEGTASSSAGAIVPFLALLIFLSVMSGGSGSPAPLT